MQEVVEYLLENPDVLFMVKEGTASLIGVSSEELKAILEVFFGESILPKSYYWK